MSNKLLQPTKKYKTTVTHYNLFKRYCNEFIKELGLTSYRTYFELTDRDVYGMAEINYPSGVVTYKFPKVYPEKITNKSIRDTAFHETLHLLLAQYTYIATSRFCNQGELTDSEEHIVNTLENYFSSIT